MKNKGVGNKYRSQITDLIKDMCNKLKPGKNLILIDKCMNGMNGLKEMKFKMTYNIKIHDTKIINCVPKCSAFLQRGHRCWAPSPT